jgi:hypothetical protein
MSKKASNTKLFLYFCIKFIDMKFVDIKNDIAFRKIFGNDKKKEIPDNVDDEGLKEAYADANQNTWSQAELDAYNYSAMREQDDRGRMEKSLQKGAENKEVEAIIGFLNIGISEEQISIALKITIEKVKQVIDNHK